MNRGNLNKLVTNYPVDLTEEEISNLSGTLAPVIAACGGGTGGKIYTGIGFVTVNNTNNQIGLTNEANTKLNQDIPTKVSDLSDSANYQTVAGMDEYLTEVEAQSTYLTKSSADTLYAPLSTTADVEALKAVSGDFSQYYTKNEVYQKIETSSIGELNAEFSKYATVNQLVEEIAGVNQTIYDLQDNVAGKQDILTFGKDGTGAISSINSTALAGQGGTTYSAGQYIKITNDTISVTGLMALDEYAQYEPVLIGDANITATSSKVDSHTQWNLAINSTPVVTDTKLTGENCVTAHTTDVSGEWAVGLVQSAYEAIDSIAGISTDVGTLKSTSSTWNEVTAKLGTAQYANDSATFLTAIPDTYALKTDIPTTVAQLTDSGNYYKKTETSGATELSTEFAKYVTSSNVSTPNTDYVMTTTGWKVLTLPGGGMTQVIHDTTLTGQGNANDNKLGVAWSALSGNTINSALSAGSATSALSATNALSSRYSKQLQDASKIIGIGDVTALQDWASSNSSTWDSVTAKLGTAQYALDSATFVTSSNSNISAAGEQYALTTTGWSKVQAGSTLTAGSGVEIVSNGINSLLGTDLAFNATTSAIQINTNGTAYGAYAFVEGSNTTASGAGAHAEGADVGAIGQGAHAGGYGTHTTGVGNFIHGTFLNFASPDGTSVSNTPVFVGGTLNATTAQDYTVHGGYLQIMGNGTYTGGGAGTNSDAYILYRDGTVKAKTFIAGGDTLSANYPVPKSVPNTADNTMQVQKMFVCTSDADIVAHAALANGEGCIFFRVG